MEKIESSRPVGYGGIAMATAAIGTAAVAAVGAVAIGALAIGRLASRHIAIAKANFKSLEVQDLIVARLRVTEVTVRDSIKLPDSTNRRSHHDPTAAITPAYWRQTSRHNCTLFV